MQLTKTWTISKKNWMIRNQEVCCQLQMQFLVQYCRWSINNNFLSSAQTAAKTHGNPHHGTDSTVELTWYLKRKMVRICLQGPTATSISFIVVMHRMVWKIQDGWIPLDSILNWVDFIGFLYSCNTTYMPKTACTPRCLKKRWARPVQVSKQKQITAQLGKNNKDPTEINIT